MTLPTPTTTPLRLTSTTSTLFRKTSRQGTSCLGLIRTFFSITSLPRAMNQTARSHNHQLDIYTLRPPTSTPSFTHHPPRPHPLRRLVERCRAQYPQVSARPNYNIRLVSSRTCKVVPTLDIWVPLNNQLMAQSHTVQNLLTTRTLLLAGSNHPTSTWVSLTVFFHRHRLLKIMVSFLVFPYRPMLLP